MAHATFYIAEANGLTDFEFETLDIVASLPKAFGYSLEVSGNVNVLNFAGAYGKAGVNYVVYPKGKYSWFPFEYLYAGYSLNFIALHGELKKTIESLLNVKKAKDLLKLAGGGISAGVSPFVAWKKDNEIAPKSWTGWFVANTLSVKARAGLGITVGGSIFAGTYAKWGWDPNFDFDKAKNDNQWYGGTIDVGVAGGTPAIEVGLYYASKFWLMDENRVYSWKRDGLKFGLRWYNFLDVKIDLIPVFEKAMGIKFPKWLKKIISTTRYFVINEGIESEEHYALMDDREDIEARYKEALAIEGYDSAFFASLDTNDNNNQV